jgi:hypothetical protein
LYFGHIAHPLARNISVGFLGEKDYLYWPFPYCVQETDIVRHGGKAGCLQVGLRILDKLLVSRPHFDAIA